MTESAFIVSGGSSGIGSAIACQLASSGHRVGIISRNDQRHDSASGRSPTCDLVDWIKVDLADAAATRTAICDWSTRLTHPLDGVVLSAVDYGFGPRHSLVESSLSEWERVMAVNLRSQFVLVTALLPILLARPRALILSVNSNAAIEPAPGRALYAASKAGAFALFRALAEELRSTNVSVVQVMPRNQIVTPGIRARRPDGFVFEGYDKPDIFRPFAKYIASTLGVDLSGCLLEVDGEGRWKELYLHGS